jgi:hypothetical protein
MCVAGGSREFLLARVARSKQSQIAVRDKTKFKKNVQSYLLPAMRGGVCYLFLPEPMPSIFK